MSKKILRDGFTDATEALDKAMNFCWAQRMPLILAPGAKLREINSNLFPAAVITYADGRIVPVYKDQAPISAESGCTIKIFDKELRNKIFENKDASK